MARYLQSHQCDVTPRALLILHEKEAYQQDLRFEAAQRLLRFTSLHCYEISERIGYSNVHYFHRQFKKRLGVTPNRYRQALR